MAHECPWHGTPAFSLTACYGHLKAAASNGHRDDLTEAELAFVGFTKPRRSEDSWRSADLYAGILASLDAEDLEAFKAILELPPAPLEFAPGR